MGMTPLEGLVMGTRSGDLDPAIPFSLTRVTHMAYGDPEGLLNKGSGLKGICGANDMREILRMANRGDAHDGASIADRPVFNGSVSCQRETGRAAAAGIVMP